jgi:hypothetical protein
VQNNYTKTLTILQKNLKSKQAGGGAKFINVSGYPNGTFLLQANEKTLEFVI